MNDVTKKYLKLVPVSLAVDLASYVLAPFYSLFTAKGWPSWGKWMQTYDNPPEGDEGYIRERSLFPKVTTGFKGYLNRVWWLIRNSSYTFARDNLGVQMPDEYVLSWDGDKNISDKYGLPGYYKAALTSHHEVIAFEYYYIRPYKLFPDKCIRIRLGWKLMSDKFTKEDKAMIVHSVNFWKSYGQSITK